MQPMPVDWAVFGMHITVMANECQAPRCVSAHSCGKPASGCLESRPRWLLRECDQWICSLPSRCMTNHLAQILVSACAGRHAVLH